MKNLTKAEEQVIQILWRLKKASTKEVLQEFPDPKPAITTVSTIIRILENKGFVSHESKGRGYIYYPLIEKDEYAKQSLKNVISNYFDGSFKNLVSFFVKDGDMDIHELEEVLKEINSKNSKK
jgi:predicted transcriptional regulator